MLIFSCCGGPETCRVGSSAASPTIGCLRVLVGLAALDPPYRCFDESGTILSSGLRSEEGNEVSDTCLRPEHIGEPLVEALLKEIHGSGKLAGLRCRKSGTETTKTLEELIVAIGSEAPILFFKNVPLRGIVLPDGEYQFDGLSQVDCLAARGSGGLAIEVKLGHSRMTRGEFTRRFLKPCAGRACAATHQRQHGCHSRRPFSPGTYRPTGDCSTEREGVGNARTAMGLAGATRGCEGLGREPSRI